MFARTLDGTCQSERLDALIQYTNESLMHMGQFDGFVGLSLLADRTTGRCITTTAWRSEEAWRAAAHDLMPIVATGVDVAGGTIQDATLDSWEVALMHRDHRTGQGACSRVTWAQWAPTDIDPVVGHFRDTLLPNFESDGFCNASLFVDRASGRTCITATYDSVEAMIAARASARRLRGDAMSAFHGQVLDVAEFELCLAHLRVPELV